LKEILQDSHLNHQTVYKINNLLIFKP
jgi:hypothetical protein